MHFATSSRHAASLPGGAQHGSMPHQRRMPQPASTSTIASKTNRQPIARQPATRAPGLRRTDTPSPFNPGYCLSTVPSVTYTPAAAARSSASTIVSLPGPTARFTQITLPFRRRRGTAGAYSLLWGPGDRSRSLSRTEQARRGGRGCVKGAAVWCGDALLAFVRRGGRVSQNPASTCSWFGGKTGPLDRSLTA
jgi:hypothetical protein